MAYISEKEEGRNVRQKMEIGRKENDQMSMHVLYSSMYACQKESSMEEGGKEGK